MNNHIFKIHKELEMRGISHANLGYKYLVKAIEIVLDDQNSSSNLTEIYDVIAKQYGKSGSSVERAVRYSIMRTELTTKEFIMKTVDDIYCSDYYSDREINFVLRNNKTLDACC